MSFLIYKEQRNRRWVQVSQIKLVNTIGRHVQGLIKSSGFRAPLKWAASEQELLAAEDDDYKKGQYRLVTDVKPSKEGALLLCQIEQVWGWTEKWWTPIALRLNPIFDEDERKDVERFKKSFDLPSDSELADLAGPIHEFLYLRHKGPNAQWYWGRVGVVNGALLWPQVFDHFVERIRAHGQEAVSVGAST